MSLEEAGSAVTSAGGAGGEETLGPGLHVRPSLAPSLPWCFLRDDGEKGVEGSTVRPAPPAPAVASQASQPPIRAATTLDPDVPFLSRWQQTPREQKPNQGQRGRAQVTLVKHPLF